ncbi:MAG: hypothetical protein AAF497_20545, partial [Planctomycetota bacterium]
FLSFGEIHDMVEATQFDRLLLVLVEANVEFILIGGLAGMAHGSNRATLDVDVVYHRDPENHKRLTNALAPFDPYLRGAPEGLPFRFDETTINQGLNFTLRTSIGDIDLLGEVPGGNYTTLSPSAGRVEIFGVSCPCVSLAQLITLKRAAGRPKDLEAISELEFLLAESERDS